MRTLIILMVRGYQRISRWLCEARFPLVAWSGCRQYPTCSDYAVHAVSTQGVVAGGYLALRRMARCNPLLPS